MKKIMSLVVVSLFGLSAFAQEGAMVTTTAAAPTTHVAAKRAKKAKKNRMMKKAHHHKAAEHKAEKTEAPVSAEAPAKTE